MALQYSSTNRVTLRSAPKLSSCYRFRLFNKSSFIGFLLFEVIKPPVSILPAGNEPCQKRSAMLANTLDYIVAGRLPLNTPFWSKFSSTM